jgi:RNA polymerase sigma factor (sigma-70 family)
MRDDASVAALVVRARDGDKRAWDEIVERYAPLVWSICRRYRLSAHDAADVGQTVWLRLVEQLGTVRNPEALAGWLATTTRRECLRVLYAARDRQRSDDPAAAERMADANAGTVDQELLAAERHVALREAFARLPQRCQRLLSLLMEDPPLPYAEISARLQMPIGGIGPNRARCLDRLRRSPMLAALIGPQPQRAARGGERHGQPVVER